LDQLRALKVVAPEEELLEFILVRFSIYILMLFLVCVFAGKFWVTCMNEHNSFLFSFLISFNRLL